MKSIILFLSLIISAFPGKEQNIKYAGVATRLSGGDRLYTEYHEEVYKKGLHTGTITVFRNAENKEIAKRVLNFNGSRTSPNFQLEDLRSGYKEGAEVLAPGKVKVWYRHDKSSELKTKELELKEPFVIDGGFNYLVKDNWEKIKSGEHITFQFVAPSQLDFFKFRVRKQKDLNYGSKPAILVILEPENFLLRMIVDPIKIIYNVSTKRILEYAGISNINDESGKSYKVILKYAETGP